MILRGYFYWEIGMFDKNSSVSLLFCLSFFYFRENLCLFNKITLKILKTNDSEWKKVSYKFFLLESFLIFNR